MSTFTCYVAECDLSAAGAPPPQVSDITANGQSIGSYFLAASGAAAINVELDWSRRDVLKPFDQTGPVSNDELLHYLPMVLGAPGQAADIGLLLADRYDLAPGQYGLMFDIDQQGGSPGPRQGCAIFLRAIWDYFYTQPAAQAQASFLEAVAYIAIHELGHAFNLWHVGDTSFMQAHPAPSQLGTYAFQAEQQSYLALAASAATAPYVLPGPGQEPFGTLAPGFTSDDPSPFAGPPQQDKLELRISLSHREFWSFEPVELNIEIRSKATDSVLIPDEIDPGYRTLQVWITRPSGDRSRYKAPVRFCRANGELRIEPGKTYRRDIAIGRQSGGFTFASPGTHQVLVTLTPGDGQTVVSNEVSCSVREASPASHEWRDARDILASYGAQRLLRFKRATPSHLECARLAQYADERASPATAEAIYYALGKSLVRAATKTIHRDYADDLRRRGLAHLGRTLDCPDLTPHRRLATTGLIEAHGAAQS